MNCVLTTDQQKSLFKKVFVDLSSTTEPLDIKKYIEDFYDLIVANTNDKALALSYVSLIPQNIRTNIGVNKKLSSQYADNFKEIVGLEDSFSNLDSVTDYINGLKTVEQGVMSLEEEIQKDSLRPEQFAPAVEQITEPATEKTVEPVIGLSDLTFENVTSGDTVLSPDKKLYAQVKRQLIKNVKEDGTSSLEGIGSVKLQVVSTQVLKEKDLYPDTQRKLQNGSEEEKARINKSNEDGAVLIVTDLNGNILYFDENGTQANTPEGKPAYFLFRNPQPDAQGNFKLNETDKQAVSQLAKTLNLSEADAKKAYLKKVGVYKNIRKYINQDPKKNTVDVSLTGGFLGIPVQPNLSLKTPLAALNLGQAIFFPTPGVEALGQQTQSYYFDLPGIPVPIQIKRPDVTKEFAENLASLLFDNVVIEQRGAKYPLAIQERIKTFEQFFYTSPQTISFKVDDNGNLVMRKFGDIVKADSPEEYKKILVDYLTRLQPTKELDFKNVGTRKVITDLSQAASNYVYKTSDGKRDRWFLIQPSQLEISKTASKNNRYEDFTLTPTEGGLVYKGEQKWYSDFIKNNFVINYPLDASGNIQTVNAVFNFDLPVDSISKIQNKLAITKVVEAATTPVPATSEINDTQLGEITEQISNIDQLEDILKEDLKVTSPIIKAVYLNGLHYVQTKEGKYYVVPEITAAGYNYDSSKEVSLDVLLKPFRTRAEWEDPSLIKREAKKTPTTKKLSPKDFLAQQRKANPDAFNKLIAQQGLAATEAQIEEAMNWYQGHPLSTYFPFKTAFNVVNLNNPNSIATWTVNGVTLFKGADFSDLYHEAWHGFTQGFLSKGEKTDLYQEARKRAGSFLDYTGTKVSFSKATDLQIEEFLAEDFREYMLNGGKSMKDAPKRNSIFRKIWNFLKALFGNTTYNSAVQNDQANTILKDMYEKLRLGNLTNFSFSVENRNFDTLNKGITAINKNEPINSLTAENSKLLLDSINSLFAEYADANNSYLDDVQANRKAELESKPELNLEEKTELSQLNAPQQTYKFTTKLFETPAGLQSTYDYVKYRLSAIYADLQQEEASSENQNKLDMLKWAIRNFGNTEDIFKNKAGVGMVGYHMANSDYVPSDIKEDQQDDTDLEGREVEGKNYYDRGGNETSIFDLANKEIINMLKGLPRYNNKGEQVFNKLGLPELNPFKETFAHIAKTTQNLSTPEKMYEALSKEVENYPTIQDLLNKLGPVSYTGQSPEEVNNWTRFWQTFNKYRIVMVQTTLNEVVEKDRDGKVTKREFEITVGNAISDYRKVGRKWENSFVQEQTNPLIRNNKGKNYLDTEALLKKYPEKASINGNEYDFLRDVGIALKDSKTVRVELEKAIKAGDIKVGNIYENIVKLHTNGVVVNEIGRFLRKDEKLGIEGEFGANGNYGKIQKLQYRFADEDADFMVVNAAGDPQSEFSQNTTLTQLLKAVNESASYSELISMPAMGYLNQTLGEPGKPYNAFAESSVWLKSLFDFSKPGGPKYPGAKLDVVNLSGLTKAVNGANTGEGDISTELDEYSKLIQDFHTQLLVGTPELTRHAGKKTSLAVFMPNYKTYGSKTTSYLYIDSEDFAVQSGDITKGVAFGIDIVTPYIISELKRINYAKSLLADGSGVEQYDFNALNKATDFVKFAGVLSEATQGKLKAVKGDVDAYFNSPESLKLRTDIENDIISYFEKQFKAVEKKISGAEYISPSLYTAMKNKLTKADNEKFATPANMRQALINSFIWNNWIQHVEESTMLYGDIALYKNEQDFFKRNTALNSTGDLVRNDEAFKKYANEVLGKPFAVKQGVDPKNLQYNGIFNTAVVSDIEIGSVYYDQYKESLNEAVIDGKYGAGKVNEADAAALVSFDTYRIIRSGLGKWTKDQENLYQKMLAGETVKPADIKEFFPVVKMGYYGPLDVSGLPLQALHKFALFPLIPTVIKGTNLEKLHSKMMNEGIDYLTFKSGSKISTLGSPSYNKEGEVTGTKYDKFYSDTQKRELSETPFIKNPVYVDYLKDQVEASAKFKGKVSFFSQLRKLIDTGLMEKGKALTPEGGAKREKFLSELKKLANYKRQELLSELGWKVDKAGKPTGDIKPLLELISRELKRRDFPEHTLQFIQTIKDNQVKNSLDISQFAEQIEAVIVAVINKRLVNFKVNGEQLVQVSGTGFENLAFAYGEGRNFEAPTAEDKAKYGSNDLPTYRKNADGTTAAAKVKIALQGQFKNLLRLPEVVEKAKELGTDNRTALNVLIKGEEWLKDNRDMITMIGARIPTQGLNSMEFVEIYEFLPEEAGSIIIAPSEITSKSGTDYDYDKLPMMMPHIKTIAGEVSLAREYKKAEAKKIYDALIKYEVTKASIKGVTRKDLQNFMNMEKFQKFEDEMTKLWGESYLEDLVAIVKEDANIPAFETFFERLNGTAAIENNIIQSVKSILSDPSNFTSLIRPNSTEKVEPFAKEVMAPLVTDPGLSHTGAKGTAVFEPLKNLQIHQSNTTGKRTLGIGAIENTYNAIFNAIGMHLNPYFKKGKGDTQYRATILLPHNTVNVDNQEVISLGNLKDAANEHNIADVISQLMNGWVDVEKDDWVSYIQGNEEVSPTLLFLVQSGVPIKDAILFVSQPLIREYVTEQRLSKSSFAAVLGKQPENPNFARIEARNRILSNLAYDFQIGEKLSDKNIYEQTLNETSGIKTFSAEALLDNLKQREAGKTTAIARQTFLHYLELESMGKNLQALKMATNVDTTTAATLYDMSVKMGELIKTETGNLFPAEMVEKIKNETAIGPYFIQEFATDVFGKLFPLRNNKVVNNYLEEMGFGREQSRLFKTKEQLVRTFKNDLVSYIFQNGVRNFNLGGLKTYNNNAVEFSAEFLDKMPFGAVVKDGKLLISREALRFQYVSREFATDNYGYPHKLAQVNENAFATESEYEHFVIERETLRSLYNLTAAKDQFDFKTLVAKNYRKDDLRKEGQTNEEFLSEVEKVSYEEWIRNKALYNILNPWIMFKSGSGVANLYSNILEKYPQLQDSYSLLKGVVYDKGELGFRNLKLAGDKIESSTAEIFHENLMDLANESKIKVEDPKDNKYISDFFKNFSTWMFMQAGQNSNNPFSFNKVISQEDIVRLLDKPYKDVLASIDEAYLNKFNKEFVKQNASKLTRLRSKNFLTSPSYSMLSLEELSTMNEFQGYPIRAVDKTKSGAAATNLTKEGVIEYVPELLRQKFEEKAWTKAREQKDGSKATALQADTFKNLEEWITFVMLHELAHNYVKQRAGEKKGEYEDRVNREALNQMWASYPQELEFALQPLSESLVQPVEQTEIKSQEKTVISDEELTNLLSQCYR